LAGKVSELSTDGTRSATYNIAAGGSSVLYAPALYMHCYSLTSAIVVQNLHNDQTATVSIGFYDRAGNLTTTYSMGNIGPKQAAGIYLPSLGLPDGWCGSAHITSIYGQPLAARVNANYITGNMNGAYAYNVASMSSTIAYLARVTKNASGRMTGYTFHNISSNPLEVTAYYYNAATGALSKTRSWTGEANDLNGYVTVGVYQDSDTDLPDGWEGSIKLVANQPWLVVVMREDTSTSTSAYSGDGH